MNTTNYSGNSGVDFSLFQKKQAVYSSNSGVTWVTRVRLE